MIGETLRPSLWRERMMKRASEYRRHAAECREIASRMTANEAREHLLTMAEAWDRIARARADLIRLYPELAHKGERDEEARLALRTHLFGGYPSGVLCQD